MSTVTIVIVVMLTRYSLSSPSPPGAYKKKGEEGTGVIGMIDLLVADLDKEMTEQ